jgi:Glycosyl transferase family 11.
MYLVGNWQSEKYFADYADTIREDLTLRMPPAGRNAAAAERISAIQSVAVHVRRGDYVSRPVTNRFHGTCGLDYYERAVAFLEDAYPDLRYYVFTDDPEWVRARMCLSVPFLVCDRNRPSEAHLDLYLMSLCRFHVIANSTFSWWGAWLSTRPDKQVVAPHRWFAGADPARYPTDDLIPSSWRVM